MASAYVALLLFVLAAIDPSYTISRRKPNKWVSLMPDKHMNFYNFNFSRVITTPYNGHILLDLYSTESEFCGPDKCTCFCPCQRSMEVTEYQNELLRANISLVHMPTFTFQVSNNKVVKVITDPLSGNPRCRASFQNTQRRRGNVVALYKPEDGPNTDHPIGLSDVFEGYVSHAAIFRYGGFAYVIVGMSYDGDYDTTNVYSRVLRLDSTDISLDSTDISHFQNISTYGVSALNVVTASTVPYVVVGNSYDMAKRSSKVPLQIYRFNKTSSQLEITNETPTVGVVGLASFVDGPNAIIVVAQAQTKPVLVLKYDPFYNTLKVIQQLNTGALPTALGAFHISDDFVGLATADDMFRIYKYTGVQGLKLMEEYLKPEVRGFTYFNFTKHYLFFTTPRESYYSKLLALDDW